MALNLVVEVGDEGGQTRFQECAEGADTVGVVVRPAEVSLQFLITSIEFVGIHECSSPFIVDCGRFSDQQQGRRGKPLDGGERVRHDVAGRDAPKGARQVSSPRIVDKLCQELLCRKPLPPTPSPQRRGGASQAMSLLLPLSVSGGGLGGGVFDKASQE